jgi:pSer/pThr/pTyr-binding forkhead associated (FHA) protein
MVLYERTPTVVLTVDNGEVFTLSALPARIGRSGDLEVSLHNHPNNAKVSRLHAVLLRENDQLVIHNRSDKNPLYVRADEKVMPDERYTVYDGDTIRLGDITFTLHIQA